MPVCRGSGYPIYYRTRGAGPPLLLIPGMASTMDWFHYNIDAFAASHYVIAQDLRGSNRDGVPPAPGPYSTRDMVRDSIAVLDELGVERAHVVALSLGGMVAQWLALEHPERVDRLSIVGNGLARVPDDIADAARGALEEDDRLARVHSGAEDVDGRVELALQMTFTSEFPAAQPEKWGFVRRELLEREAPPETHTAQLRASIEHDTRARLAEIRAETQVIVGELDAVNAEHAPAMVARIGRAELHVMSGMHHGLNVEFADAYNDLVLDFLHR